MTFRGIPPEAFEFYVGLEADNTKAFWQANRETYDAAVRQPVLDLAEALGEYGPFHVFRPYVDARFAKGRAPYKTHQGAYGESEGGSGYYFQIGADGLLVAAGYHYMAADQLERFRAAVLDDGTGGRIAGIAADVAAAGCALGAHAELKTAPRGIDREHPRIELLRRKGLTASRAWSPAAWMHTRKAADRVAATWEQLAPMCRWLDDHVGPSTLPPPDRF